MALSDFAVFSDYTYEAMTEVLSQQVDLFNQASNGAIILQAANMRGDYNDVAFWAKISGLVRRRNPYGTGTVTEKNLAMLVETMVKVAAGTPPVRIDPGQFEWINANQEEGGAVYGQQLAKDMMADMLNTAIMAYVAALTGEATVTVDDTANVFGLQSLLAGAAKFGDRASEIQTWLMHSTPMFGLYGMALENTSSLFNFGTVNVRQDGFGRPFIVSDSPALISVLGNTVADPDRDAYYVAGLVPGAIMVGQNDDFTQNVSTTNGGENIVRTIQSEWSYNLSIKGYTWDKTSGGKAPNDAALATANNWDRVATSHKDTAGVLLKVA